MDTLTILSGAGLSAEEPTHAPLGNQLRDAYILAIMDVSGGRSPLDFPTLRRDPELWEKGIARWRLETVVQMLADVIGRRALLPLQLVLEGEPSRAHRQ